MKVYIDSPAEELLIEYAGGAVTLETRDPIHGKTGALTIRRTTARELRRSLVEHMPADVKPLVPVSEPALVWYQVTKGGSYWKAFPPGAGELVWDPGSGWMPGFVSLNDVIIGTAESKVGAEVLLANWAKKLAASVDHGT